MTSLRQTRETWERGCPIDKERAFLRATSGHPVSLKPLIVEGREGPITVKV